MKLDEFNSTLMSAFTADRALMSDIFSKAQRNLELYRSSYVNMKKDTKPGKSLDDSTDFFPKINLSNRIINIVSGQFLQNMNLPFLKTERDSTEDEVLFAKNVTQILRRKLYSLDGMALIDESIRNSFITGLSFLEIYKYTDDHGNLDIGFRPVYIDSCVFDAKTNFNDFQNTCNRFGIKFYMNKYEAEQFVEQYDVSINDLKTTAEFGKNIQRFNTTSQYLNQTFNVTPEDTTKTAQISDNSYLFQKFYTKAKGTQKYVKNTDTDTIHFYYSESEKDIIISDIQSKAQSYKLDSKKNTVVRMQIVVNNKILHTEDCPMGLNQFPIIPFVFNQVRGSSSIPFIYKTLFDEIEPISDYVNKMFYYCTSILRENATSITLFDSNAFKGDKNSIMSDSRNNENVKVQAVTIKSTGDKSLGDMVYRVPAPEIPSFLMGLVEQTKNMLLDVSGLTESAVGSAEYANESALNSSLKMQSAWKSYEFVSIKLASSMKRLMNLFTQALVSCYNPTSLHNKFRISKEKISTVFRNKYIPLNSIESVPNDVTLSSSEKDMAEFDTMAKMGYMVSPKHVIMASNLSDKHDIYKELEEQEKATAESAKLENKLTEYKGLHTGKLYESLDHEAMAKTKQIDTDVIKNSNELLLKEKEMDLNAKLQAEKIKLDHKAKILEIAVKAKEVDKKLAQELLDNEKESDNLVSEIESTIKEDKVTDNTKEEIKEISEKDTTMQDEDSNKVSGLENQIINNAPEGTPMPQAGNVSSPEEKDTNSLNDDAIASNLQTGNRSPMDTVTEQII